MRVDSVAMLRTRNLARIANCISPATRACRQRFRELESSRIADSKKLAMLMNAICRSTAGAPPARAHPHPHRARQSRFALSLLWKRSADGRQATGAERDEGQRRFRNVDENYCSSGWSCIGCGCALACDDGCVGGGLRAGVATGRGGSAAVFARWSCSEALATSRVSCSWLARTCSTVFAFSPANRSWPALSSSIPC